jgi:peptide/nickel transport system substrate-binding protein
MRPALKTILAAALLATTSGLASAQTFRIGLAEDPDVLDPTLARSYVGRIVFASLCDKLFDVNETLDVVPQLALSQTTSDDGKEVTIKLRPGVKFHDGEPMDAEAVKYSLDRHLTMPGSFRKPDLGSVDRVEVVDPLTVRLVLKAPFSPLIAQLTDRAGMIVSPKAAKEVGDKFGQKPVCAGPFKFVERVQQDRIVLEKFGDYWNKDNIHFDRVVFSPIPDSTVRLANLRSGQLDMLERAPATDIKEIKANPRLKLASVVSLAYSGITMNIASKDAGKTGLGIDAKVRQALNFAIDRKAINEVAFNGEFMPGNQWVNPQSPWYQKAFPVTERNVEKAKALLKDAGVKTPLVIDFMVPNNPEARQVSEIVQAMAAEAGFDMKIRVTEFATSLTQAEQGNYQAYLLNWSGRTDPDGNAYSFHVCGQPLNYTGYCNKEIDALLGEARTKSGIEARKPIYEKATRILLDEGGVLYLYHSSVLIAHTDKLQGYRQVPDGLIRLTGASLK